MILKIMPDIWKKRKVILHFAFLNVKLRYKGTNLGFLWNALEPLLTFLLLYVVFTSIRERPDTFAMYLLAGMVVFHVFTRGTIDGLGSLRNNKNLITTMNLGNGFFPVVSIVSNTLTAIVEVVMFLILLPVFQFVPSWTIILLPIPVIMMLFLVWGLTYLLSIISIYVKDIQPIWGVIAHALFFISPIFWYLDEVDGFLLEIMKVNPVGQIIELTHQVVIFGNIPPLIDWLYTASFIFGIFVIGFLIFRKYEKRASEEL